MNQSRSLTYISWAANCSRSDHTARELGGSSHMVYWEAIGSSLLTIWLKYLDQAFRTWRILLKERPSVVFVMAPPPFAPLIVLPYCLIFGASLVIDAHSGAFVNRRWRHFQWLQHWLCRRAVTTIVHNEHLKQLVEEHGGHAILVTDVPVRFEQTERYTLSSGFNVAVVCSFAPDEPIAEILAAASRLPGIRFYVTGNPKHLDADLKRSIPANVTLTGFLPDGAYGSLLQNADVVMSLTKQDHTMLRGAWEAAYQGTPVVISDWPLLRAAFDTGAVHVDNSPDGIAQGILEIQRNQAGYREGARALMHRKEQRWQATRDAIIARMPAPPAT